MRNKSNKKEISHKKPQKQQSHRSPNFKNSIKGPYSSELSSRKKFESGKKKGHNRIESYWSEAQHIKIENKLMPTDQSNNNIQSSIMMSHHKPPNQEYFHEPMTFKHTKCKTKTKRNERTSQLENISIKLEEMTYLVSSQDRQLKKMSNSLSERQLHRLVKIHSIEKLKMLEKINVVSGLKKSKQF